MGRCTQTITPRFSHHTTNGWMYILRHAKIFILSVVRHEYSTRPRFSYHQCVDVHMPPGSALTWILEFKFRSSCSQIKIIYLLIHFPSQGMLFLIFTILFLCFSLGVMCMYVTAGVYVYHTCVGTTDASDYL